VLVTRTGGVGLASLTHTLPYCRALHCFTRIVLPIILARDKIVARYAKSWRISQTCQRHALWC
jgi:hypothetical protein